MLYSLQTGEKSAEQSSLSGPSAAGREELTQGSGSGARVWVLGHPEPGALPGPSSCEDLAVHRPRLPLLHREARDPWGCCPVTCPMQCVPELT